MDKIERAQRWAVRLGMDPNDAKRIAWLLHPTISGWLEIALGD